jgi:hypothetical protein
MTDKPTGGSAFPVSTNEGETAWGMTLRDWFAGQALTGFGDPNEYDGGYKALAKDAYELAAAMLAERAK